MAALFNGRENIINILQVSKTSVQKLHGKTIEVLIQMALVLLESMTDVLISDKEIILEVFMAVRICVALCVG